MVLHEILMLEEIRLSDRDNAIHSAISYMLEEFFFSYLSVPNLRLSQKLELLRYNLYMFSNFFPEACL